MAWTRIVAMQMERSGFPCWEAEVAGLNERLPTRAEGGVGWVPGSARSRISHDMHMLSPLKWDTFGSFERLFVVLPGSLAPLSLAYLPNLYLTANLSWLRTSEVICYPKLPKQEGWAKNKFFLGFEVSSEGSYVCWQQLQSEGVGTAFAVVSLRTSVPLGYSVEESRVLFVEVQVQFICSWRSGRLISLFSCTTF